MQASLLFLAALAGAAAQDRAAGESFRVDLAPCEVTRPERILGLGGLLRTIAGTAEEKLVARGEVAVGEERFAIYLPEAERYRVENTADGPPDENNSTAISIDADGDGRLAVHESWFASAPVRIGDRMFQVQSIAADATSLELAPSEAPLAGLVVGRRCPPFELRTQDGNKVRLADFRGKVLLLDIWSAT